ncbi:MAG: UDP-3-O-(3-hydroxymyristoyl)glucosamine N-acyltransferase [Candidatus Omnitrophica bacterium]|nr:UDP-3-O-(3-hydroxymyristoyl)glucosamine N-acyltransferase [Candidatus Omnitrophota bacterium]
MEKTLQELAALVQGTVVGDGKTLISGITSIEHLRSGYLTYLEDSKKLREIENSSISALVVTSEVRSSKKPLIQVQNPKLAWAVLLSLYEPPRHYAQTISEQAFIAKTAKLGKSATVEAFAFIGEGAVIGNRSVIRAYAYLDQNTQIGDDTVIHPHVVLYAKTQVGSRVTIHAGSIIGADGFGYVFDGKKQSKVPQVGNVIVRDDAEIGACVTIDRATVGSTIIGQGVKIDNLVQIAHNVEIGSHSCLSAQVGISGSSKIGNYVVMGGRAGLGDHCEIGDEAVLGAQAGVPSKKVIPPKQTWIGQPARPYEEMRKQVSAQLRSYETQQLVQELKKRIEALEKELSELKASPRP